MPRTYRACLIGCGRMGATIDDEVEGRPDSYLWQPFSHAAAAVACDRTDLVAVADVVAEKAESIRQRYGAERAYTDYRQMIEKEKPDIVCIATRPGPHADITVFAAENDVKGHLLRKAALLFDGGSGCDGRCRPKVRGSNSTTGTQRRYMPVYRKVRELVDAGEIGNIQCTIAQYGASSALWGLTHAADMLLFLASDPEVDFVQGTIVCRDSDWDGNRLDVDPAITSGYVRFANGVHGYNTAGTGPEFEVCGSAGKIRILNNSRECQFRKKSHTFFEGGTVPRRTPHHRNSDGHRGHRRGD